MYARAFVFLRPFLPFLTHRAGWPAVGCNKVPDSDPYDDFGLGTAMAGIAVGWYPPLK